MNEDTEAYHKAIDLEAYEYDQKLAWEMNNELNNFERISTTEEIRTNDHRRYLFKT